MLTSWYDTYKEEVYSCSACCARLECQQPVPGVGSILSKIVFVGRNPGRMEDIKGEPFCGPGGQYYSLFLVELGLVRESIFTTNLYLCHTKANRLLDKEDVVVCMNKFLFSTLDNISPKVVIVFGAQANVFLNGLPTIGDVSGKVFRHKRGFFSIPYYHPASLCHRPDIASDYMKGAKQVRKAIEEIISGKIK